MRWIRNSQLILEKQREGCTVLTRTTKSTKNKRFGIMYSYVTTSRTRSGTSDLFKGGNNFWFISASRNGEEINRMEFLKGNKRLHRQMPDREP